MLDFWNGLTNVRTSFTVKTTVHTDQRREERYIKYNRLSNAGDFAGVFTFHQVTYL